MRATMTKHHTLRSYPWHHMHKSMIFPMARISPCMYQEKRRALSINRDQSHEHRQLTSRLCVERRKTYTHVCQLPTLVAALWSRRANLSPGLREIKSGGH
mmetsp:Transcript_97792/g.154102  ORF Transcript_97792/g.154102 Transcript_97792/m.154102 type:complete len:100 (+) Transcript_97792:91-390(+)